MAILKVALGKQNAVSGTVSSVSLADGKFGQQYRITFDTGDDLYLPKDGFERQAARANLLPNEYEGKVVTIWRKPMDGDHTGTKGYWNIDIGNTAGANRVADVARNDDYVGRDLRSAGVPLKATSYEEIKDKYVACLGDAVAILRDAEETLGVPFTPAEYMSAAATLYIQRTKVGV